MPRRDAKLQVPIDQAVLDQLQDLAGDLGFDSVPAMVRFWAKAELSQRSRHYTLSQPNAIVLRYVELILALSTEARTARQAFEHLLRQLKRTQFKGFFNDLPQGPTSDKIFGT